jgi:hypothetical protein
MDGEKMEFTNINDSETVRICIEDAFSITDGLPLLTRNGLTR